jgi:hypothetical protein
MMPPTMPPPTMPPNRMDNSSPPFDGHYHEVSVSRHFSFMFWSTFSFDMFPPYDDRFRFQVVNFPS